MLALTIKFCKNVLHRPTYVTEKNVGYTFFGVRDTYRDSGKTIHASILNALFCISNIMNASDFK